MDLTRFDMSLFLFAYGMVISGAYIVRFYNPPDRFQILVIAAIAALFWTVYLRWWIGSRLDRFKEFAEPDDDEDEE